MCISFFIYLNFYHSKKQLYIYNLYTTCVPSDHNNYNSTGYVLREEDLKYTYFFLRQKYKLKNIIMYYKIQKWTINTYT